MPAGVTVKPKSWTNVIDLYDDGTYSAIWGNYRNSQSRCIGVRWKNDPTPVGYPHYRQYPLWYVEPSFLVKPMLLEFCGLVIKNNALGKLENIIIALQECS